MKKQPAKQLDDEGENAIFSEDEGESRAVSPREKVPNKDTVLDQDNRDLLKNKYFSSSNSEINSKDIEECEKKVFQNEATGILPLLEGLCRKGDLKSL